MQVQTHTQAPAVQLWVAQTLWLLPGFCLIAGLLQEGRAGWQKHCRGSWLLLCPVPHCHLPACGLQPAGS